MNEKPERGIDTPNFLRLAQELRKFKNPYKAADMLLSILSSRKEGQQHE